VVDGIADSGSVPDAPHPRAAIELRQVGYAGGFVHEFSLSWKDGGSVFSRPHRPAVMEVSAHEHNIYFFREKGMKIVQKERR